MSKVSLSSLQAVIDDYRPEMIRQLNAMMPWLPAPRRLTRWERFLRFLFPGVL